MKKVLLIAAALSTMAAPAMAHNWKGKTYADGIATYDIKGVVPTFCRFGSENNKAAGLVNATDSDRTISLEEGDRTFNITNLASPSDNTVQAANGSFVFERAVCNTGYTISATSTNGGLKHTSIASTSAPFLTLVPYSYSMDFGGVSQTASVASTSPQTLVDSGVAHAGPATFSFTLSAQDSLLLKGDYQDTVVITLAPKA